MTFSEQLISFPVKSCGKSSEFLLFLQEDGFLWSRILFGRCCCNLMHKRCHDFMKHAEDKGAPETPLSLVFHT